MTKHILSWGTHKSGLVKLQFDGKVVNITIVRALAKTIAAMPSCKNVRILTRIE